MKEFFEPLHRRIIAGILAVLVIVLLIASCTAQPQPVAYAQPQPQVVQQGVAPVMVQQAPVVVHDGGFWSGVMAGHFLSGGGYYHQPVIVAHPVVVAPRPVLVPRPVVAPAVRPAVPTYVRPAAPSYSRPSITTSRTSTGGFSVGRTSSGGGRRR